MSRHEQTDMDPKYILYFGVGLVVVGFLIFIGLRWMFQVLEREQALRDNQPGLVQTQNPVPEPRLQINPQGDLEELRSQENEILSTYRWIDRGKGIAGIPIDRAMSLF